MDYWEFLIQQEGDQTWLPLENKQVEILEGRYRVAVHTSLVNTPVDIRVSQLVLTEMPPRRRVRKRKGRTTDAGLLVIFPYMQLSPGRWEIHCSGTDVLDDFMGSGWERVVQLEVVPYEEDAWDPSWNSDRREAEPETSVADSDLESGPLGSAPDDVGPANTERSTVVAEPSAQDVPKDTLGETGSLPLAIEVAADSTYGLQLDRQALVAQPGRTVFLEGEIFSLAGEALPDSELSVQLRDPQTAQVLMETRQHLSAQSLPARLSVDLKLQTNLKTRVVLGAVSIRAKVSQGAALASASFTITAGLHDLLDAIANQASALFEEEISVYPGSTEPFTPPQPAPETLIAPELPLALPSQRRAVPSAGLTLPPQLYTADEAKPAAQSSDAAASPTESNEVAERSPELPKLPRRPAPTFDDGLGDAWATPLPTEGAAPSDDPVALANGSTNGPGVNSAEQNGHAGSVGDTEPPGADLDTDDSAETTTDFAAIYQQAHATDTESSPEAEPVEGSPAQFDSTLEDEDIDAELAAAVLTDEDDVEDDFESQLSELEPADAFEIDDQGADDSPVAYVEQSFQSLDLQSRFWDRLTALTHDGHQAAAKLRDEMSAAGVRPVSMTPTAEPAKVTPTTAQTIAPPPARAATNEVVVYDEPPAVIPAEPPSPPERAEPINLTPPKIDVPEQDLVAGELVSIRLRLKAEQYRPYAKVWMNDRQTRTLLEDPRLVMHFTPNSFGELETLMRIKVPLGCMELQIAAIAVDMATLQESSRTVVNRQVIPPDLPSAGLDDF